MGADTDDCDYENCVQVFPVEGEYVLYEVYYGGGDDDEQHEHGNHHEERGCDGVEQKTEGNDKDSDPFGSLEAILFVEGEVFIGSEDVDADG